MFVVKRGTSRHTTIRGPGSKARSVRCLRALVGRSFITQRRCVLVVAVGAVGAEVQVSSVLLYTSFYSTILLESLRSLVVFLLCSVLQLTDSIHIVEPLRWPAGSRGWAAPPSTNLILWKTFNTLVSVYSQTLLEGIRIFCRYRWCWKHWIFSKLSDLRRVCQIRYSLRVWFGMKL
jgi:hypothetical protein